MLGCELALRGPFYLVDEPLFYKRYHEGNRYTDWRGRMAWIRPDLVQSGRPTFPTWMQLADYVRTIQRVPLPLSERAMCFVWFGCWAAGKWRGLGGDLVTAGSMLVHSKQWRQARYAPEHWL